MAIAVAEIGAELGKGLLSGIASKFGAKIFDNIFPSGTPDYFGEVYQEIEKIVKEEIEQNTIVEIDGNINGVQTWVKNVYIPRKDSGASKQELFDMIKDDEYDVAVHMIAVLQEPAYAEPGLGVFVIGAGMHLTLLQELAFVDPSAANPNDSSYAVSVKKYAQDYADYADPTYDSIETKRTAVGTITPVKITSKTGAQFPGQIVPDIYWFSEWTDEFLDKTYKDTTILWQSQGKWSNGTNVDLEERSTKSRSDHIEQVKVDTAKNLHDPKGVAALWRQLEEQPIPPQALA